MLIKELSEIFRFFFSTPLSEREVVFYAEHRGYSPNFEGLINELIRNDKKSIAYITSDKDDPILSQTNKNIKTFYINKLLPFFMLLINCKVFVMTLTELGGSYLKRSINDIHYVYVFHSMVSTHMMFEANAFDYYDSILCVGPHQIREIRKREQLKGLHAKKLVEAGYYRLERIYSAYKSLTQEKLPDNGIKTILIAPSWGDENLLKYCGIQLVELLLRAGYNVIVRPHPETVKRLPELIKLFEQKFGSNSAFLLEKSIASDQSLFKADMLITDCSGVMLEYAFGTERPVISVDVPIKIKNPSYLDIQLQPLEMSLRHKIGEVVAPSDLNSIPEIIDKLLLKQGLYKSQLITMREMNVFAFGHSSEIGAKYIAELVGVKKTNELDKGIYKRSQ